MYRWTARFAVLLMLVPVIGPLALAQVGPAEGMHCMRRPLAVAAGSPGVEPAMPCHHGATQSAEQSSEQSSEKSSEQSSQRTKGSLAGLSASPEASFRSVDCCRNHDCCRSAATSEWAQPARRHSSYVRLLIEPALSALGAAHVLSPIAGADSARAPPRS
jgi:hypothetical protein